MALIFFDLEGPLTFQDCAYELMRKVGAGRVFEAISRYDDILTLEGREGYEPGDTLFLIYPFLLLYGVREEDIAGIADNARITEGACELVSRLKEKGWGVYSISTSYFPYARRICEAVGIDIENLASTLIELDWELSKEERRAIKEVEDFLNSEDSEGRIRERLDRFFWEELPGMPVYEKMRNIKPCGGRRKVDALLRFAKDTPLEEICAVGDSITDIRMLEFVRDGGGLSVAFNANEYALPFSNLALASRSILDLYPALLIWEGGVEKVREFALSSDKFSWIPDLDDLSKVLASHKKMRMILRGEAGKLG